MSIMPASTALKPLMSSRTALRPRASMSVTAVFASSHRPISHSGRGSGSITPSLTAPARTWGPERRSQGNVAPKQHTKRLQPPAAFPHLLDPEATEPFTFFNTIVLIPWLLMIIAPKWDVTKKLLGPTWFMVPYALIDTWYFVATAILDAEKGEDVNAKLIFLFTEAIADPQKMLSLFDNAAYAAQDWVHLCTWDMLAGRWIWLDSLATGVPVRFALLTAFNSGPPGLLVYLLSRAIFQKPEDAEKQVGKV